MDLISTDICDAIRDRKVIQFDYEGGIRIIEPHCHGISTAGNEVLRGYQVGGYSQSGKPVEWKMFVVGKMGPISTTGAIFSTNRPGYNPKDRGMITVHCCV